MTRLHRSLALCLLLLPITACGGGDDGADDDAPLDGNAEEPLVNGEPASLFYGRFAFATTQTGVDGAAAFPTNAAGRNAYHVTFFLMPGNQLALFYAEGEGEVTSTGYNLAIDTSTKRRRSGTWRVDGARLVLDGFMRCDGILFNGSPALSCTLASAIGTPEAQDRSGTFRKRLGAAHPDDSEFADYVP